MQIEDRTSMDIDWEAEFADDPDFLALPPDGQKKLLEFLERSLEMKVAAIYGSEDENVQESCVDCGSLTSYCQAKCCTLMFALTEREVQANKVAYNKDKPFFIARDESDGYCPHLDRNNFQCEVWDDRPIRCRSYDCKEDTYIWPNGFAQSS